MKTILKKTSAITIRKEELLRKHIEKSTLIIPEDFTIESRRIQYGYNITRYKLY